MTKKELRKEIMTYYRKNIDNKAGNNLIPYEFVDLYAFCLKEFNWWWCRNSKFYNRQWYCGALQACCEFEDDFREVYNL